MGRLSKELQRRGFVSTGEESPVDKEGTLYANRSEIVCDETGVVIDGDHTRSENGSEGEVYRYRNSKKVKLVGGHVSSYDWGHDEERGFTY